MAAALKQFKAAYTALQALRGGLGGVGRALGLPRSASASLLPEGAEGGAAAEAAGGQGAMDPKPPQEGPAAAAGGAGRPGK
jgi:hypothetical protein